MKNNSQKSQLIGQLLIDESVISEDDLQTGLIYSNKNGVTLGQGLKELGLINESRLLPILARQKGLQFISLKNYSPDSLVLSKVDISHAERYRIIPLSISNGFLTIASSQPLDLQNLDDLALLLGYRIKVVLACENEVMDAIHAAYGVGADTIQGMIKNGSTRISLSDDEGFRIETISDLSDEASIIKFINQILIKAFNSRATDIHIEPFIDRLRIRYRVDGLLYSLPVPEKLKTFHSEIVSRIKIMSRLNIAERRLPQDGRCKIKISDSELDLRISILPSIHGENVNIRFLSQTSIQSGLEKLGVLEDQSYILENVIKKPYGMLLVTGPTGSGKTTTLYTCLNKINITDRKIITVEDPVEYQLDGITQIQVNPKAGLTFSRGLRSMLRHDPDVMMVGEIRDTETAQVAIQVALTGHLLLSSVHTNNATSSIVRLINMGIEPYLVASSVECVVAQRLVRLICPHCKQEKKTDLSVVTGIESDNVSLSNQTYIGLGCHLCNNTGYLGRTGVFEILILNDELREAALRQASSREIKQIALKGGMTTLRQDGLKKVAQGITSIEEVLRVTQETD